MQIHRDAFNGDNEAISLALDAGVPVDVTDILETTPLMVAVSSPTAHPHTVKLLLERGADPNAAGGNPFRPVLGHALLLNDPYRVQLLLDAGADITITDESGFDALIWAVQGPATHLMEVVELLLERGAPAVGETDEGESALTIASNKGRFDVVKRLLEAGADETYLGWTPLLRAVALGSLDEVQTQIKRGADLSKRDFWGRTPWLLSLAVGDLQRSMRLLAAGANRDDTGYYGKTALMYPIETNHPETLNWLLSQGFNPDATNDFGKTALMEAASINAVECAHLLLNAGADIHLTDRNGQKAIAQAGSSEIIRLLTAAGQNLNELTLELRATLLGLTHEGELESSPEEFEVGRQPRFGSTNPEKMDVPFWRAMVKSGATAYVASNKFASANKAFDKNQPDPIWSYHRQGKSLTALPDGRFIEIGGSHEDWYDPNFHIYNDVFVHHPNGHFDILGYPVEVFPPTDFHSATFANGFIYIIGCLGHMEQRAFGHTAVYRLNVETLAIEKVETTGQAPGYLSMHQGTLIDNEIHVCGGECTEVFILNLDTHHWRHKSNESAPQKR